MSLRLTRRQWLSLLAGLPFAIGTVAQSGRSLAAVPGLPDALGEIRAAGLDVPATELTAGWASGVDSSGGVVAASSSYASTTSGIQASPFPFQAVAAKWRGDRGTAVYIRTSERGDAWSDWLEAGEELVRGDGDGRLHASGLVFTADGRLHRYVQIRIDFGNGRTLREVQGLRLVFIDASSGPSVEPLAVAGAARIGPAIEFEVNAAGEIVAQALAKPPVISRAGWGCPDPEGNTVGADGLPWAKEYRSVTHCVIHHTANSNTRPAAGWASAVRAIWYWHAVSQPDPWGDIGYNYLIDPDGVIYEGRAGGDDVIAGHTYTFNAATMGIGVIGTYTSVAPPAAALASLQALMAWKADQKGFAPEEFGDLYQTCSNSYHRKERIASHRDFAGLVCPGYEDLNATTCPGDAFHALLPQIRTATAALIVRPRPEFSSVSIGPQLVAVGGYLQVTATIRNGGNANMLSGSPDPSYVYQEGQVASTSPANVYRLALDYEGHPSSTGPYPYRWGVGGNLAPGASRTVTCKVKIGAESGPRKYWVGLIYEGVGVAIDHRAESTIYARVKNFADDVGIGSVTLRPTTVFAGGLLQVTAEVQNWGGGTPPTQGRDPGYIYQEGETCPTAVAGAYRIGVDYEGRTQSVDHPYRWGIGVVPPLSVRTITGYIRMPTPRAGRRFWVGMVKEHVAWLQNNLASTTVTVSQSAARVRLPLVMR